jgi:hypothetical protein
MNGLARACGSPAPWSIKGRDVLVRPLTLGLVGVVENWILLRRPCPPFEVEPLASALDARGAHHRAGGIRERAFKSFKDRRDLRTVTPEQLLGFLHTPTGAALSAWLCVRPRLRKTVAGWAKLFFADQDAARSFVRARDMASGMDLLAHLDWRPAPKPPAGKKAHEQRPVPWRVRLLEFAKGWNCPVQMIRGWTLYQLQAYLSDEKAFAGGTTTMTPAEALALSTAIRAEQGLPPLPEALAMAARKAREGRQGSAGRVSTPGTARTPSAGRSGPTSDPGAIAKAVSGAAVAAVQAAAPSLVKAAAEAAVMAVLRAVKPGALKGGG